MRINIDDNGYVKSWAIFGDEHEYPIEVDMPKETETFMNYMTAFQYSDGALTIDHSKLEEIQNKDFLNTIRTKREEICFPVINRGQLWYNKLNSEQISELNVWYQNWLDVTETKIIPETPSWVK